MVSLVGRQQDGGDIHQAEIRYDARRRSRDFATHRCRTLLGATIAGHDVPPKERAGDPIRVELAYGGFMGTGSYAIVNIPFDRHGRLVMEAIGRYVADAAPTTRISLAKLRVLRRASCTLAGGGDSG